MVRLVVPQGAIVTIDIDEKTLLPFLASIPHTVFSRAAELANRRADYSGDTSPAARWLDDASNSLMNDHARRHAADLLSDTLLAPHVALPHTEIANRCADCSDGVSLTTRWLDDISISMPYDQTWQQTPTYSIDPLIASHEASAHAEQRADRSVNYSCGASAATEWFDAASDSSSYEHARKEAATCMDDGLFVLQTHDTQLGRLHGKTLLAHGAVEQHTGEMAAFEPRIEDTTCVIEHPWQHHQNMLTIGVRVASGVETLLQHDFLAFQVLRYLPLQAWFVLQRACLCGSEVLPATLMRSVAQEAEWPMSNMEMQEALLGGADDLNLLWIYLERIHAPPSHLLNLLQVASRRCWFPGAKLLEDRIQRSRTLS